MSTVQTHNKVKVAAVKAARHFESQPERALLLMFLKNFISRKETIQMYDNAFECDLHQGKIHLR